MNDIYGPQNILLGCLRLTRAWPKLIGEEHFQEVIEVLYAKLEALANSGEAQQQIALAHDIVAMLKPYPEALARLKLELEIIQKRRLEVESKMELFIRKETWNKLNVDTSIAAMMLTSTSGGDRTVIFHDTLGRKGAKTQKIGNIDFNFQTVAPIIGSILPIFADANPILIWAALLVTLPLIGTAMNKEIAEREATVFWGCTTAKNQQNIAQESAIIERTNNDRKLAGLSPLGDREIQIALQKLTELKCIKPEKEKTWTILEDYRINF